jgi:hypothetical protein
MNQLVKLCSGGHRIRFQRFKHIPTVYDTYYRIILNISITVGIHLQAPWYSPLPQINYI